MATTLQLQVNGRAETLAVPPTAPLLQVLRNDLQLNGPKYGCGLGECGACLVLVDGVPARSCAIPVGGVAGREVTTLEGLEQRRAAMQDVAEPGAPRSAAGLAAPSFRMLADAAGGGLEAPRLHPVQQAFIDCQAAQCGYCLNGMIVATVGLLERVPQPSDRQVRDALSHNLCRCGTHLEILDAVQRAAELMAAGQPVAAR